VLLADRGKQAARDALTLISEVEERCRSEHNRRHLVSVLAHQALALANLGRQRAALDKLTASLDLARRSGFCTLFHRLGPMAALLQPWPLSPPAQVTSTGSFRLLPAQEYRADRLESTRSNLRPGNPDSPCYSAATATARSPAMGISVLTVKRHTGSPTLLGQRPARCRGGLPPRLSQTD
jgi:hypothetical protein